MLRYAFAGILIIQCAIAQMNGFSGTMSAAPQMPTNTPFAPPPQPQTMSVGPQILTMSPAPEPPTMSPFPQMPTNTPFIPPTMTSEPIYHCMSLNCPGQQTMTAAPQPPTMSPFPQIPSMSPTSSQRFLRSATSTPRTNPIICTPESQDLRCSKPASIVNQYTALVMSPRPSSRPPVAPVIAPIIRNMSSPSPRVSALPSIPPENIPPYIPARVSFPEAKPEYFQRPVVIQQIQASLACSFRLPLENIQIQNISFTNSTSRMKTYLQIDPSQFMMSSSGSVQCLEFNTTTSSRRLQQTTQSQNKIECDYIIVNPSVDVLVLNETEFTNTVSSSDSLNQISQSAGGSGVSTEITIAEYAAPAPLVAQPNRDNPNIPTYTWYILGVGVFIISTVIIAIKIYTENKTKKIKRLTSTAIQPYTNQIGVIVHVNTTFREVPLGRGQA